MIGPLNGNLRFPPAFRARESAGERLSGTFHGVVQIVLRLLGEKKRYDRVLISGGERTRHSLRLGGCVEQQMVDVTDAGVDDPLDGGEIPVHAGTNHRFLCSARLVNYKAVDLAIRAVAAAQEPVTLDIFGDGPCRGQWEALARELSVADRVTFRGWYPHENLMKELPAYRGFVFSSLAEANGIVMQEAMMAGIPVIALRWGGPVNLADDRAAVFVEPDSEAAVVAGLAAAMSRLATDPAFANALAGRARRIAKQRFTWPAAIAAWTDAYACRRDPPGSHCPDAGPLL